MPDPYANGAEDYADFLRNNPQPVEVKLTATLIVRRYLEKLRSHPGSPERRYPPEYYADELVEEIATALKAATVEITRLREALATSRALREFDTSEIERLRQLLAARR
jgi:hypothetical protein